jgi:hypothetical protein
MNVAIEITTAELQDVRFVPIEAVFNDGGKTVVFKWVETGGKPHAEKWPVLVGQTSDHAAEIRKGLEDGEKVLLSRPASSVTPANYHDLAEAVAPPPEPTPLVVTFTTAPATGPVTTATAPAATTTGPAATATAPTGMAASAPASASAPGTAPAATHATAPADRPKPAP